MWNLWLSLSEKQEMSSMFPKRGDMSEIQIHSVDEVTFLMNDKLTNCLGI
jgi:hypothetical protein